MYNPKNNQTTKDQIKQSREIKKLRLLILASLSINVVLFLCLWILEARMDRIESLHVGDKTPLEVKFSP